MTDFVSYTRVTLLLILSGIHLICLNLHNFPLALIGGFAWKWLISADGYSNTGRRWRSLICFFFGGVHRLCVLYYTVATWQLCKKHFFVKRTYCSFNGFKHPQKTQNNLLYEKLFVTP